MSGSVRSSPSHSRRNSDSLPPVSAEEQQRHNRVINCLSQLESLNLDRPEGMVISRHADDIIRKLPKVSQRSNDISARVKAAQYQEEIEELIELHKEFSRSNMRLWKKVTKAVHMISRFVVLNTKKISSQRDPSLRSEIDQAVNDHQALEKERLLEVKSALQLLKSQGEKSGKIKKKTMEHILNTLGIEKIMAVAQRKQTNPMSIMERVNMCADFWLAKVENPHTKLVEMDEVAPALHHQGQWPFSHMPNCPFAKTLTHFVIACLRPA